MVKAELAHASVSVCMCVCDPLDNGALLERAVLRCNNITPEAPITPASHTNIQMHRITHLGCFCPWKYILQGQVLTLKATLNVLNNCMLQRTQFKVKNVKNIAMVSCIGYENKQKHICIFSFFHTEINIEQLLKTSHERKIKYTAHTYRHTHTNTQMMHPPDKPNTHAT